MVEKVNDWVKNAEGRYLWVDEAVDQSTTPLDWEYVGCELPTGVNPLDILIQIDGALYYKNTTDIFAAAYNAVTDGPRMVEHKLYDAVAERALGEGIANGTGLVAGTYIYKGLRVVFAAKGGTSLVQANRTAGNLFRDELAAALRAEGRTVNTEAFKWTPFGKRYMDLDIWHNGVNLGA